jgi:hypothetical protein
MSNSVSQHDVYLICVLEKKKLRVKVLSDNYLKEANCQFPKNLRISNRKFKIQNTDISLIRTRGKYFYSVKKNANITILPDDFIIEQPQINLDNITIYTDDNDECICCLDKNKVIVLSCGHYNLCEECSIKVDKCPMCRTIITNRIHKNDFSL